MLFIIRIKAADITENLNEETLKDKFQTTNNLEILEGETFKLELQNN